MRERYEGIIYPPYKLCSIFFFEERERGSSEGAKKDLSRTNSRKILSRVIRSVVWVKFLCGLRSTEKRRRHIWNSDARIVSLNQEKCGPGEFQRRNIVRHPRRRVSHLFPPRVPREKEMVESACVYDWITFVLLGCRSSSDAHIFNPSAYLDAILRDTRNIRFEGSFGEMPETCRLSLSLIFISSLSHREILFIIF